MITDILRSKTVRQVSLVTSGTIASALIGSIFFIICARLLGPAQFGVFSILTTILILLSDIFDFGTNGGIVRFVSEANAKGDQLRKNQALKLSFVLKLTSGLFLVLVGLVMSGWVARQFLRDSAYSWLVFLTLATVLPSLLFDFVSFTLQAEERFKAFIVVLLTSNTSRLFFLLPFLYLFMPVAGALQAIIAGLLVSLLLGFWLIKFNFWQVRGEWRLLPQIMRFNGFIAVSFIAATISARLDIFLLTRYATITDVGLYSAANRLAFIFPQIVAGLGTVFGPKFGSHSQIGPARIFFKKVMLATTGLAIGIILLALVGPPLVRLFLGANYEQSIPLWQILLVGMAFLVLQVGPTSYINYFLGKPALMAVYATIQLGLVYALNIFLIPRLGAAGSAVTFTVSQFFIAAATLVTVFLYGYEKA